MLPWSRPQAHSEFENEAAPLRDAVRKSVTSRGGTPHSDDFKGREIWNASWKRGSNPPGMHKLTLVGPSPEFAKCVFCERILRWKTQLDVEHYRPKVAVKRWDGDPPLVSDTPPKEIDVDSGYYWLAFTWENYSLSCGPCNRDFKRNLFPVVEPRLPCREGVERTETPLLLEPGSSYQVRDHIRFTVDGIMDAVSEHGRATIITCGLNRNELRVLRTKVARDTLCVVEDLQRASLASNLRELAKQRDKLARLGARTEEFTSMVRFLAEEKLKTPWETVPGLPR